MKLRIQFDPWDCFEDYIIYQNLPVPSCLVRGKLRSEYTHSYNPKVQDQNPCPSHCKGRYVFRPFLTLDWWWWWLQHRTGCIRFVGENSLHPVQILLRPVAKCLTGFGIFASGLFWTDRMHPVCLKHRPVANCPMWSDRLHPDHFQKDRMQTVRQKRLDASGPVWMYPV